MTTSAVPTAIVVGGNFAGLAAGIALRRAGIEATVYERADALEKLQGAKGGIHLWPNAMRALGILGVRDRVLASGLECTRSEIMTTDGKVLTSWPLSDLQRDIGQPTLLVQRSDLHRALVETLDEVAPGAVSTGMRCVGISQDETGVTARFENGEEVRADVLVGADGLRSVIRTELFGPPTLRPAGGPMLRGDASALDNVSMEPGTTRVYFGRGFQLGLNRIDADRFSWFLRTREGTEIAKEPSAVSAVLHGWADPVERIVAATSPDTLTSVKLFDSPPGGEWGDRRVTLAGDAAHPMLNALSQGAAQAFEDAAVLQQVVAEHGLSDLPAVLRAYEQRRKSRASGYVKRSRFISDMGVWSNPVACAFRSTFMRVAGPMVWRRMRQTTSEVF